MSAKHIDIVTDIIHGYDVKKRLSLLEFEAEWH
jgi:hypothetical protein